MKEDILKKRMFSRRAFFVGGVKLALSGVLVSKLYQLQITEHQKYSILAKGNRVSAEYVIPKRGIIYDRIGNILAENRKIYNLYLDTHNIEISQVQNLLARISDLIILPSFKVILAEVAKSNAQKVKPPFILVKKDLSWEEVAKISANLHEYSNFFIDSPLTRFYPSSYYTSHIIGYTGNPSEEAILRNKGVYRYPDYKIGISGMEEAQEELLKGKPGMKHIEKDSAGRFIRNLNYTKGKIGQDVKLTIDLRMQKIVYEALRNKGGLGKESGSAIVMDVKTGEILAMASLPSFDNNLFIKGISKNNWQNFLNNPDAPFSNKAISGEYSPGSTFKTIVAIAALEHGVINPNTIIDCSGKHHSGERFFHCWKKEGHGKLNLQQAIAQSCNVYFYEIATSLGIEKIANTARKLGLGQVFNLGLQPIAKGIVPDEKWKIAHFAEEWYLGETLNVSIGQGETLVTPLQLAVQMARIVSHKNIMPSIIKKPQLAKFSPLAIKKQHIKIVRQAMEKVVNDPYFGIAYHNRISDPNFRYAGKTGTVQVISVRKEKGEEIERRHNYHSLFIGYAPIHSPKYAISIIIEHGGSASAIATPTAKQIFENIRDMEKA